MSTSRYRVLLAALLLVAVLPSSTAAQEGPAVTCVACIVIDDTGRVLFERDSTDELPNASTTKMVTALVAREHTDLEEEVVVSPNAAATGAALLRLPPGGVYTVEELLHALLMASSNEAAVALAEHVSGTESRFVGLMNAYARELGTEGTAFVTSHGLDQSGHHSTAADLALIAERLLEDKVLARIVATDFRTITGPGGAITLDNRNLLLDSYRGAIGVKTGFTALAGNVLVAAARRSGRTLIAVAMRSVDATADAAAMLDFGYARLRESVMVPAGRRLGALVFADAGSTGVIASRTVRGLVRPSEIDVVFVPEVEVGLPIEPGEAVGMLEIRNRSGRLLARMDAIAERSVEEAQPSLVQSTVTSLLRGFAALVGAD